MPDRDGKGGGTAAPRITVELSPDKLQAFIILGPAAKHPPVSENELRGELEKAGVVIGIKDDIIPLLAREGKPDEKVCVAEGTAPVPAKDGRVEYFFDFESMGKPRMDEQGRADFKNINLFVNVKPGGKLAKIHPPVPGTDGKAVTGVAVKPAPGKPASLLPGQNAVLSKDDPSVIEAAAEGAVAVRDGRISVEPVMEIPGGVDYATGNIDFNGALTIRGDVKSGFSVKAAGSLVVLGVVEDASLRAGGDISVQMGCVGTGKGSVEADGSVFVRFAERQKLAAQRDVVAGDYLLNCAVRAGNAVKAVEKSGLILGGEITATNSVAAKIIGNEQGVETRITVGYSDEVLAKLRELDGREKQAVENQKKVQKGFEILKRIKLLKRELPPDKKTLLLKLVDVSKKLQAVIQDAAAQRERLAEETRAKEEMRVTVLDTLYPGTTLNFLELGYKPATREQRVTYRLLRGEIKKTFAV
jgi:hypothetical protein